MTRWTDVARETIARVHRSLPETATLEERTVAIDQAYPFGEREHWPYKAWLKERRYYLSRYGHKPPGEARPYLSPLERAKQRAERRAHPLPFTGGRT